jgi:hypothetical protein
MLFRAFVGSSREQAEVLDAVVEDGAQQLRGHREAEDDNAIVVQGEAVEEEEP